MGRVRVQGVWLFLTLVVAAYGVTALLEPDKARAAVAGFLSMLGTVTPVLLLVLGLMIVAERFFTRQRVEHWLGRDSGPRGWLLAAAVGVTAVGPVYTWYALLAQLRNNGMRTALVAVILYARAIKLPLLPVMAYYFGLPFTLVLSGWLLVFALVSGIVMQRFERIVGQEAAS